MIDLVVLLPGILSLIYVVINVILGCIIISKYLTNKKWETLSIGIAWMALASSWISDIMRSLMPLITQPSDYEPIYLFIAIINVGILPILLFCWIVPILYLLGVRKEMRNAIIIIEIILSAIFDIIFFYFYFTDRPSVGEFSEIVLVNWSTSINLFFLICIAITLITGIMFARASLKSNNTEIKMKGELLMIAFAVFTIGAVIDTVGTDLISNLISRAILIISSIIFYMGLLLPQWAKNILLKKNNS